MNYVKIKNYVLNVPKIGQNVPNVLQMNTSQIKMVNVRLFNVQHNVLNVKGLERVMNVQTVMDQLLSLEMMPV